MPRDKKTVTSESVNALRAAAEKYINEGTELADKNNFFEAISNFQDALNLYKLIPHPTQDDLDKILDCYSYIEAIYTINHDVEAIELYNELILYLNCVNLEELRNSVDFESIIATAYERLWYHYELFEYHFEALACAIGAALIYEKVSDTPPIKLLQLYMTIIYGYNKLEGYAQAINYCKKAIHLYYTIENPSDKIKHIVINLFNMIDNYLSNDQFGMDLKHELYKLGIAFPRIIDDFYSIGNYNMAVQFCRYINGSVQLLQPSTNNILLAAKSHLVLGMTLAKLNQHLEAISEYYRTLQTVTGSSLINFADQQYLNHSIQATKDQMYISYKILSLHYSSTNNMPLFNLYRFCSHFFITHQTTLNATNKNTMENELIDYLQQFINMCKQLINIHDRNCQQIGFAVAQLLPFISDQNKYKLICDAVLQELLSLPSVIDKIKLLSIEINKFYSNQTHALTTAHQKTNHPIYSPPNAPNDNVSDIRTSAERICTRSFSKTKRL